MSSRKRITFSDRIEASDWLINNANYKRNFLEKLNDNEVIDLYIEVKDRTERRKDRADKKKQIKSKSKPMVQTFEDRFEATDWLVENTKFRREFLEKLTDNDVMKMYNGMMDKNAKKKANKLFKKFTDIVNNMSEDDVQGFFEGNMPERIEREMSDSISKIMRPKKGRKLSVIKEEIMEEEEEEEEYEVEEKVEKEEKEEEEEEEVDIQPSPEIRVRKTAVMDDMINRIEKRNRQRKLDDAVKRFEKDVLKGEKPFIRHLRDIQRGEAEIKGTMDDMLDTIERRDEENKAFLNDLFKPVGWPEVNYSDPRIDPELIRTESEERDRIREEESEDERYTMSLLNKAIYRNNPQAILDATGRGDDFEIIKEEPNYMIVEETRDYDKRLIVVVKGTDLKDIKGQRKEDLLQDVGIFLNNEDMVSRTKEINKIVKELDSYEDEVIITGHSLGGYIANKVSLDNNIDAIVFNMGSSPIKKTEREDNPRLIHYTTNVGTNIDPVSMTASRIDKYDTRQVQPKQDIGSGLLKYHTIDHFLKTEDLDEIKNLDSNKIDMSSVDKPTKETLKSFFDIPAIAMERQDSEGSSVATTALASTVDLGRDRDPLADNSIRRVNANSAFIPNPLVPSRNEAVVEGLINNNREMRNDPDPSIISDQSILEQDRVLEGPVERMPYAEAENPLIRGHEMSIAGNNMSSMDQNYFLQIGDEVRRGQLRILGVEDDDEDEYKVNEGVDEEGEGYDPDDDAPFEGGASNGDALSSQIRSMNFNRKGQRLNPRTSKDWRRIMRQKAQFDDLLKAQSVRNEAEIPVILQTRSRAGNNVNLIRRSNQTMTLAMGQMLP